MDLFLEILSNPQGILLVVIIILALIFVFINGFHDAANAIATIVATRVLSPLMAVLWAGLLNFAAYFVSLYVVGGSMVGDTIATSVIEQFITLEGILVGLIAS